MDLTYHFILPIIGGYAFSISWYPSLYVSSRESGHRLYFRSIFYSVFLVICAVFLHMYLFSVYENYRDWLGFINTAHNFTVSKDIWSNASKGSIFLMSFVLGIFGGHILNLFSTLLSYEVKDLIAKIPRKYKIFSYLFYFFGFFYLLFEIFSSWYAKLILRNAIKNNDFEKLLFHALERDMPILFTLDSGKVYVGWMIRGPNPVEVRRAVRILPLLSGYRDKDTHEVNFTTSYENIFNVIVDDSEDLNHLNIGDFEVVIPSDCLSACHLFDVHAYSHFKQDS